MAKKNEKAPNAVDIDLRGGPRDGETLRVCIPPPSRLRLGFPEWANYYQVGSSTVYEFDNQKPWVSLNVITPTGDSLD